MTGEAPFTPAPQHHTERWENVFKEIQYIIRERNLSENATYNDIFYNLNSTANVEIDYYFDYSFS